MKRISAFLYDSLRSDIAIVFCALVMSFTISIENVNFVSDPYWIVRLSLLILPSIYLAAVFFSTRDRLFQDIKDLQMTVLERELSIETVKEQADLDVQKAQTERELSVRTVVDKAKQIAQRAHNAELMLRGESGADRGYIPLFLKADVIKRAKEHCEYCGRMGSGSIDPDGNTWHVDHVVAVSRGGLTHLHNLVLACKRCNLQKKDKPVYQFVQELIRQERKLV